ncbi:MFS transporter [Virgisporangium ochraceum]|uniref:MFS transporter n=1 Tax=Virgisporangium ochraceum TaxID=65505 RepID=A0A8J4A7F8_9ACTN|nr:MFS transporter [Virgisporangium ochraceum]GIJ74256.1 MFS transporter [Virgisporangium ochraceum]
MTGHPRRWAILGVLVVSLLVVVLDNTVLNVALGVIADPVHGLGATQGELEWSINSYTLVFAGLLFTAGVLGDRLGRRRVLMVSLALFGISSLVSAYAQDPTQLIVARALMGIGGAGVMPATLSIISNVFDPRERGKAIGVWAGAVGLAVAIGPIVAGLLLERFWWGSVFLINVPIVVVGLVAIALLVPESKDPHPGRIDLVGVGLSIVGLVLFVYGIIDGGEHGFDRPRAWGTIAVGALVIAAFVWFESRLKNPSLDVRLFRNPAFSAAVSAVGLVFFAMMGTLFFSVFYLQLVRGYTPLQTGLMMLPFAVAQLLLAPRSASFVRRFGPRAVCATGLALVTASLVGMVFLEADTPLWVLGVLFFVQGAGMANVMPPATESVMSTLPREKAGVGSAVSNTIRQLGGSLGVAVLGSVLAASYRGGMEDTVAGLPEPVRHAASESIAGAYGVAGALGPAGRSLIAPANAAFVDAMHLAAGVAAVFAVFATAVVLAWMPRRSAAHPPAAETGVSAAPEPVGANQG